MGYMNYIWDICLRVNSKVLHIRASDHGGVEAILSIHTRTIFCNPSRCRRTSLNLETTNRISDLIRGSNMHITVVGMQLPAIQKILGRCICISHILRCDSLLYHCGSIVFQSTLIRIEWVGSGMYAEALARLCLKFELLLLDGDRCGFTKSVRVWSRFFGTILGRANVYVRAVRILLLYQMLVQNLCLLVTLSRGNEIYSATIKTRC